MAAACKRLSPGSLSDVGLTQFGYHIIKLTGRMDQPELSRSMRCDRWSMALSLVPAAPDKEPDSHRQSDIRAMRYLETSQYVVNAPPIIALPSGCSTTQLTVSFAPVPR